MERLEATHTLLLAAQIIWQTAAMLGQKVMAGLVGILALA
jgi:hypothetical protein